MFINKMLLSVENHNYTPTVCKIFGQIQVVFPIWCFGLSFGCVSVLAELH